VPHPVQHHEHTGIATVRSVKNSATPSAVSSLRVIPFVNCSPTRSTSTVASSIRPPAKNRSGHPPPPRLTHGERRADCEALNPRVREKLAETGGHVSRAHSPTRRTTRIADVRGNARSNRVDPEHEVVRCSTPSTTGPFSSSARVGVCSTSKRLAPRSARCASHDGPVPRSVAFSTL
jgi:hypothetical protein